MILTTFQVGFLPGDFFFSINKSSLKIVAELLHKAQKYMIAEDTVIAKGVTTKRKKDEGTSHNPDRTKETWGTGHALDKEKNLPNRRPKFTSFTPLVMPIKQVLMQIKDELALQWLRPIHVPTKVRDKSKYCRFHQDHDHRTEECRHLQDQVETLIH